MDADEANRRRATGWLLAGLLARLLVGGLFVATGWIKIIDPAAFAEEIQNYELAPIALTHAMALILPWLELLAGLLLISGLWRTEARGILALMLVVFTGVKVYAYAVGKTGPCGCGGDVAILNLLLDNPQGIFTNLGLLTLLVLDRHAQRRTRRAPQPTDPLAATA